MIFWAAIGNGCVNVFSRIIPKIRLTPLILLIANFFGASYNQLAKNNGQDISLRIQCKVEFNKSSSLFQVFKFIYY